jgi:phage tail sheath protein FI
VPTTPTYPGVYIEEIPSGVHPITAVATSIAAFVDFFTRGPMNEAVQVFSFADFERTFGGLNAQSEASYAIQQFFLNGGTQAWVVRVASGGAVAASVNIRNGLGGGAATALTVAAASAGTWGNSLRVRVDQIAPDPNGVFNLTVTEYGLSSGRLRPVRTESYVNLVMDSTSNNFADTVVNGTSELVRVTAAGNKIPAPVGSFSDTLAATVTFTTGAALPIVDVRMGSATAVPATFPLKPSAAVSLAEAAALLEAAIRGAKPDDSLFSDARVDVAGSQLRVLAGPGDPLVVTFAPNAGDAQTVADLKLTGGAASGNVQEYELGFGTVANTGQGTSVAGTNGTPPGAADLIGTNAVTPPTGVFALEKVDLFNILCLPRIARVDGANPFPSGQVQTALSQAISYCNGRRAFFIVDTPSDRQNLTRFKQWMGTTLDNVRDKNAAVYFPRVVADDPLNDFRPKSFGASGVMAGVYARTDSARGVWKAPAGTGASLRNLQRLEYKLSDPENGVLNPLGINCLRTFDVYGNVSWGARTLEGSDQQASDWKYVPVRRFALFLEESLFRGTKWVVFEPNDEPLWAQIRLNVGAFMHDLFRKGAFQGTTPRQAYLVKCDKETTTQTDIDDGVVNILVGFAPLKPAEFVIIRIQQLAGQIET